MKIELKDNSPELKMVKRLEKLGLGGPTDVVREAIKLLYDSIRIREQKRVGEYQAKLYSEETGTETAVLQGFSE